ncbi:hypothetical protein HBH56_010580 [Parastagonospora nodorum]|uniref:DUF7729 domain-containing protein n=2 Tax=Phaeosphaeria nodorum (strain SN15 / ATCC MYA-4574 / FGSC 10173) TaxID=321614 RepID=A0A7U2ETE1_PHANO|nr:hypothetical protein SNOG_00257 [Parastagonospora nodorum SN15]KAH3920833.1 hypothetical protein HBH56_010580 [Parastagonospora nodorum]EAT91752.1 hypothetical protein SNOG_00257 [Parastagonospora nodorum SN15]KAH3934901.1 hypothetical protein HBH54_043880 [Parastagonospora nodorum]KAH3943623.1 hypothetical protein HBH53_169990 [Parastagonospora nodorum]KAH3987460.1 hypothetical protein HBH52_034450 [Parastagonospora nodorum]
MGPNNFVQPGCEPRLVHGFQMSHHEASPLPNRETPSKRLENSSRAASCSLTASRPPHTRSTSRALLLIFVAFCFWTSLINTVSATNADRPALLAVHVEDDLAWKGSALYVDHQAPPTAPSFMPPLHNDHDGKQAARRAVSTDPSAGKGDFTIPEPFDTGLSNNLTNTCAAFLQRMRGDASFRKCHPFSLLLQTSSGFFDASKSYLRITQTLDATCGVNASQCRQTMDSFARELQMASACKQDLDNDMPLVIQALNGLVAYPVAYSASCLRDTEGSYCFANAVSNTSSPTDSYSYYLPVGQELPAGSRPTCNSCLQDAMAVFAQYANNATQPVSRTYAAASQQLTIGCGRSFVNVTAAPLKAAAPITTTSLTPTLTLVLMFILYFFQ